MRHHGHAAPATPAETASQSMQPERSDRHTLKRLLPYLWTYKWRVVFALGFMVGAKLANVSVPILLKNLIDTMTLKPANGVTARIVMNSGCWQRAMKD